MVKNKLSGYPRGGHPWTGQTLAIAIFFLIVTQTFPTYGQYVLQASDVSVATNGHITACAVNNFNTSAYQNGDIEIPEQIGSIAIKGIDDGVFSSKGIKAIQFPSTLESIGAYCFDHNLLTALELPDNVRLVRRMAFTANNISQLKISKGLSCISYKAFSVNPLGSLTIPNSVTHIEAAAFSSCALTRVEIPASVAYIGNDAFYNNQLQSVTLPEGVSHIGSMAFLKNKLSSVTLPSTVVFVDRKAFGENNLTCFVLPCPRIEDFIHWTNQAGNSISANTAVTNLDSWFAARGAAYELTANDVDIDANGYITRCHYSQPDLVIPQAINGLIIKGVADEHYFGVFGSRGLLTLQLPRTLEYIGNRAFYSNNIATLTIPHGVKEIAQESFMFSCVKNITFEEKSSLEKVAGWAFHQGSSQPSVKLPNDGNGFVRWEDGDGSVISNQIVSDLTKDCIAIFEAKQRITFLVTDGVKTIEGAVVTVDGWAPVVTGSAGTGIKELTNASYSYEVVKPGFQTLAAGPLTLNGSDVLEQVLLATEVSAMKD